ncbi:MAG: DEAD/DEAH box helicase [bacterium]|nr:DEAD/DEAH box helicase [bacterium]
MTVTELALAPLVRAPLSGHTGAQSPLGRSLGASRHRRFQDQRIAEDPGYRTELALEAEFLHQGWTVLLRGRADGVQGLTEDDTTPIVIEELKTGIGKLDPTQKRAEAYALQAATYAWMLTRTTPRDVETRILWWPLDHSSPSPIPVRWNLDEIEARIRARLDLVFEEIWNAALRNARMQAAAVNLRPPHQRWRPAQEEIVEAVEHALDAGEHLLLQAPTGAGKTGATLLPVAKAALREGRRVFFLTSRRTQQRLPLQTLARMAPPGIPFAVQLRAKRDLCATGAGWCHESACALASDPGPRGSRVLSELLEEGVLDGARVLARGKDEAICPYALAHTVGLQVPFSLADVHHLIHPHPLRGRNGEDVFEGAIVVVDEIHNLLDRAREAGSTDLDAPLVRAALERAALGGDPHHRAERELAERTLDLLETTAAEAGITTLGDQPLSVPQPGDQPVWVPHGLPCEDLAELAEAFEPLMVEGLIRGGAHPAAGPEPFTELAQRVAQLADERWTGVDSHASLVGWVGGQPALRRLELDPSPRLRRRFAGLHALIGLTATLEPAALHRDGLGLDPDRTNVVHVRTAEASDRQRVVIDPGVDTTYRARARQLPAIARRLVAFAEAVPGNTLAVLPSHEVLEQIRSALPCYTGWLEAQSPRDGDAERTARLALLDERRDVLLLAVAGGLYTEGVDYPGDRLHAVAVVGPCLPPPTPERQLLAEHLETRLGDGRDAAFAVPGMIRVVQAVGRLLRTPDDRGVALLLGRRFLREPYRGLLPEAWLRGGEPEDLVADPPETARAFFAPRPGR